MHHLRDQPATDHSDPDPPGRPFAHCWCSEAVDQLTCTVCGRPAQPSQWRCECGGPLDLPDIRPTRSATCRRPAAIRAVALPRLHPGVRRGDAAELTLGEGMTPLIARRRGPARRHRSSSTTCSRRCRSRTGARSCWWPRRCSAAPARVDRRLAAATRAARSRRTRRARGCPARCSCPSAPRPASSARSAPTARALELVPGDRTATTQAAIDAVSATGAMYASHIYDPYFLQGTKTYAFELWEQLGRGPRRADPARRQRHAAARGRPRLSPSCMPRAWCDGEPALIAVQSERCAPLARAWAGGLRRASRSRGRPDRGGGDRDPAAAARRPDPRRGACTPAAAS